MSWGEVNVHEQRVRFVVLAAKREKSIQALCQEFDISRETGYRWIRRYAQQGVAGVVERSRRPRSSPQRTATEIEQRVVELRRERPDWGARKLTSLLEREGLRLGVRTVHRILLRQGLVRQEDQCSPASNRFERAAPNELWQMDFKGPRGWDTPVGPLTVIDDHSRYALRLQATGSTQAAPVQRQLRETFQQCGLPEAMLMDHGTPWWNMQSVTGWSWLTVWLMKLGIRLLFSAYRHPQTQGKIERFHGSLERARQRRGWPSDPGARQAWLDDFRWEYNHLRPHEALAMSTPATRWRPSGRSYQEAPHWEYEPGAVVRQLGSQGQLWCRGRRWEISMALAREWVQLVEIGARLLVYYRRTLVRELDQVTGQAVPVDRLLANWGRSVSRMC